MTQELWRLDDTSVANGSTFARVNSNYHLYNLSGATVSRTTTSPSPIQGGGCYRFNDANTVFRLRTSAGAELTAGVFYIDYYLYLPTTFNSDNYQLAVTGNDTAVEYGVASVFDDGKIGWASYDTVNGFVQTPISSAGAVPKGEWVRVAVRVNATGPSDIKIFKGKNINGTTADVAINTAFVYNNWEWLGIACADASGSAPWFDSVILDNSAYPTRLEATVSGSNTASTVTSFEKTPVYISSVSTSTMSGTANNRTATVTLPNLVSGDTVVCVGTELGIGDDFYLAIPSSTSLTLTNQISVSSAKAGQGSRRRLVVSTATVSSSITAPQITLNIVSANNTATASTIYMTAYVLKGAASTAFGAKTTGTSTTNNLTTASVTTTGASSLIFGFAYDGEGSAQLDTSDLYLPSTPTIGVSGIIYSSNIGLNGWAGWKLAGASGSSVTANFDGLSTNTVDWMYGLLEVLPPSASTISASGSETASGSATANYSTSISATGSVTASGSGSVTTGKTIDASASITGTGSSSAVKTLNVSADGSATASGSVTATVTSGTKTIDAAATVTASASAGATKTMYLSGSGQATASPSATAGATYLISTTASITATGSSDASSRPLQTADATGYVTATSSASVATTVGYFLVNPIVEEGLVEYDPYYNLIRNNVGVTVVKRDGIWQSVRVKVDEWLQDCEVVFRGGYENQVTAAQKAELETAGYTVETRNI